MRSLQKLLCLAVVIVTLLSVQSAHAQTGIEMDLSAAYKFGEHVTFMAEFKTPMQVSNAFLVIQDDAQVYREAVSFNAEGISVFR